MTDLNAYRQRKAAARAYHPSVRPIPPNAVRPIWTPHDALLTAEQFHADIANTERGELVEPQRQSSTNLGNRLTFSRSRFRRAKIMDAIAVALLMALMAAIGCIVVLASAPTAKADSDSEAYAYAAHYAGAVCAVLDDYPNVNGMLGIMAAITDDGLSNYQAGQVVGISIAETCPRYGYLVDLFVSRYGGSSVA